MIAKQKAQITFLTKKIKNGRLLKINKKICPKCKSENIRILVTTIGESPEYVCNKCGYSNTIFPELKRLKIAKK